MKRELSTMVCDVRKPTYQISVWVNSEKLLFVADAPRVHHKALHENKLVALYAHNPLPFTLKVFLCRLFSFVHLRDRLERLCRGNNILVNPRAMTGDGAK